MMLSDDKISHLSHVLFDGLWKQDLIEMDDENEGAPGIKAPVRRGEDLVRISDPNGLFEAGRRVETGGQSNDDLTLEVAREPKRLEL